MNDRLQFYWVVDALHLHHLVMRTVDMSTVNVFRV